MKKTEIVEVKNTKRRIIEGIVVSNKMDKTVKVEVSYLQAHPQYKKVMNRRKTFFAHTEKELKEGEICQFERLYFVRLEKKGASYKFVYLHK